MPRTLTIHLDAATRKQIARLARRHRLSPSEVIRQAIAAFPDNPKPVTSPYAAIRDLIGIVHIREAERSWSAGRQFGFLLKCGDRAGTQQGWEI
jgi:predicted transcriptional regulator